MLRDRDALPSDRTPGIRSRTPMTPPVRLAGMAAVTLAAACSSTYTSPAPEDAGADASPASLSKPWRRALSDLAGAPSASIYSFAFDAAPPEGSRLTFAVHLTDGVRACARYAASSATMTEPDFWYLQVDLNGASAGDYAVTTDRLSSHTDRVASVALLHRYRGELAERYRALSGTISVRRAPGLAAFHARTQLQASADLSFALHPAQALECRGGRGPGAPADPTTCSCEGEDGERSECTLQAGHEQCCFDTVTALLPFHIEVDATPCAAMCRAAPGLSDYCGELAQP